MKILVKGHVQKVGYRYSISKYIRDKNLEITGEARNLSDGTVQILAEGDLESLKVLRQFCKIGSEGAIVREIVEEIWPIDQREFEGFSIF